MERIGLVEPDTWPLHCKWWFRDKEVGTLPCDPYSRLYYLSIGYRPNHSELYDELGGKQYNNDIYDGVSPVFTGEQEPPAPRLIDVQGDGDVELSQDRLSALVNRIRTLIFDEKQVEIEGTARELSDMFGYLEPSQFGRDIRLVQDKLMEFGIDIERSRTPTKRTIRIYENEESPYHPLLKHMSRIINNTPIIVDTDNTEDICSVNNSSFTLSFPPDASNSVNPSFLL